MPDMPRCSIIIPTFNSAKTLARALDSIIGQTFADFEILIVDGLSTDGTLDIIAGYSRKDNRIRLLSEQDKGIYDAMNKGIDLAKGDWLYFLGSDDRLYSSDVLASVLGDPANQAFDVLYGNVFGTVFNGIYDGEFTAEKILDRNICHQAIFFRKEVFARTGKYDLRFRGYADWDHNFRWFLPGSFRKKYLDLVMAEYAEGGFSNTSEDAVFKRYRVLHYLRSGKSRIPVRRRLSLVKSLLGYAWMKKDLGLILQVAFRLPAIVLS